VGHGGGGGAGGVEGVGRWVRAAFHLIFFKTLPGGGEEDGATEPVSPSDFCCRSKL
jgi:hypothetical protein